MKKKILMCLCAICFIVPISFMLVGCNNSQETYNVNFDYGKAVSFFESSETSASVLSNEWITTIPNIKDEYKDSFLGWYVQGTDTEVKNYSYIGANCTLEARFDINCAPSGLYQNGKYVMTWGELKINYPNAFTEEGEIGNADFTGLSGELVIDMSITTIESNTFKGCNKLTNLIIPDSVTTISYGAFENCMALKEIKLPNKLKTIQTNTFKGCTSLEDVQISKSVESIVGRAFEGCTSLTEITIPKNVTFIPEWAFKDCVNLTSVTICGNVDTLGAIFEGCTSLNNVVIEEGVTRLYDILNNCDKITNITLPSTLEYIDDFAFKNCSSLSQIYIPSNVSYMGGNAFAGCDSLININVSAGNKIYKNDKFNRFIINKETYTIICGVLPGKGYGSVLEYDETMAEQGVIGEYAFYGNNNLTRLNSVYVNKIDKYAFVDCKNLTEVEINYCVMEIDTSAFFGCP